MAKVGSYATVAGMVFDFDGLNEAIRSGRPLDAIQRSSGIVGGALTLLLEALKKTAVTPLGKYGGFLAAIITFAAATTAAAIEGHVGRRFEHAQVEANRAYVAALGRKAKKMAVDLKNREKLVVHAMEVLTSFH